MYYHACAKYQKGLMPVELFLLSSDGKENQHIIEIIMIILMRQHCMYYSTHFLSCRVLLLKVCNFDGMCEAYCTIKKVKYKKKINIKVYV